MDIINGLIVVLCATFLVHALLIHRWPDSAYVRNLTAKLYRRPRNLAQLNRRAWLSRDEFAQLEKDFPGLSSVIVISRTIDEPTKALGHAVLDNFGEGVKYSFFVSHSANPDDTLARYRDWFRHLFDASQVMVNGRPRGACTFESCFSIRRLEGNWDYVPYVFYTFADGGTERLLALKGSEAGVGLASGYARVEESEARTIINLISVSSQEFGKEIALGEEGLVSSIPAAVTTTLYIVQDASEAA